jgi:poly(beta-D-mannuronate) lyase
MPPLSIHRTIHPPDHRSRRPARAAAVACLLAVLLAGLAGCFRPAPPPPAGLVRMERIRPPFDVEQRRAIFGQDIGAFTCPKPSPTVRDVLVDGFSAEQDSSIVSPEAMARYQEAVRPLTVYETQITSLSDTFVRSRPAAPAAARCVLEWLEAWVAEGGLLGQINQQGQHERKWALSAIAWSYVKIQGDKGLDPAKRRGVEAWIRRLALEVTGYTDRRAGTDARNHQAFWAAASAMAAAVALDDRALFTWSLERYRAGLAQIQPDGTLPLELARKTKSRHYHTFALAPLVLIAETGTRNDLPLYQERGNALGRLADRVIAGLEDPAFFERAAGARQEWLGTFGGGSIPWAEPYYARFRDARLLPWLARFRPIRHRWFGGDATLCFGVKEL